MAEPVAAGLPPAEPEADQPLAGLAAAGAPLRRALARLAGRFVAVRGWEALGFVRAGDWARERLGLSGRELHDLARTDAALARLPRIEAAFVAGRLSWTKARLLARVASAPDEAAWLARAGGTSAAALAQRVRAMDRGGLEAAGASDESGAPEEACETLRIPCAPRVCARWGAARYLARRVAGEWLSPATLAEQVTAEPLSALLPLEVDPETLPPSAGGTWPPGPADAPTVLLAPAAPATPSPFVAALTDGLETADARTLDARLRRAGGLERGLLARLGPLLLELASQGDGWRCAVPGCSSYANLHAHHVRFRSAGGGDELANLTTLCAAHHLRSVHAPARTGRIAIHGRAPERLRFETPLGSWASGDVRISDDAAQNDRWWAARDSNPEPTG